MGLARGAGRLAHDRGGVLGRGAVVGDEDHGGGARGRGEIARGDEVLGGAVGDLEGARRRARGAIPEKSRSEKALTKSRIAAPERRLSRRATKSATGCSGQIRSGIASARPAAGPQSSAQMREKTATSAPRKP